MKIISKYVLKEHVGPLTFALTALTSLLLLNYIAKQFGQLVGKGLAWSVIGEFFLLSIPFTVAMTLPMAVLVSTLYAFSRLAAEHEITAMKASGLSLKKVMVPVLLGASVLALLMVGFNDQLLPRANHRLSQLQGDIARKKPTFALREQVINEVSPGKLFLRTTRLDEGSNRMKDVVIYDMADPQKQRTIVADSGDMAMTEDQRDLMLTLYDGYMQEIPRNEPTQLQRLFFEVDFVRVRGVGNTFEKSRSDYKSDREMTVCEMQKEIAQTEREKQLVEIELEQLLVNGVREVALGIPPEQIRNRPSGPPPRSLGRLYCDALAPLVGVKPKEGGRTAGLLSFLGVRTASAAQSPRPQQPQRPPRSPPATPPSDRSPANLPGLLPPADSATPPEAALPPARAPGIAPSSGLVTQGPMYSDIPTGLTVTSGMIEASVARIADRKRSMSALDVEIQKKFALAVACVVLVLLGAPIALRFPRGGVGMVIGVSFTVFALYYVCLIAGESLADRNYLTPFWAMWAANILFGSVGLVLLARMGKESSTARGGDLSELLDTLRAWFAKQMRKVGVGMDRRSHAT